MDGVLDLISMGSDMVGHCCDVKYVYRGLSVALWEETGPVIVL